MHSRVRFIDTLRHAPYTESTICRRRKCGSAVQIGRGPATVIGHHRREPGCPPKLQRTFVLREKEPSPTMPRHLAGLFCGVNFAEPWSTQIFAAVVFHFRGTSRRPLPCLYLFLTGSGQLSLLFIAADRNSRSCRRSRPHGPRPHHHLKNRLPCPQPHRNALRPRSAGPPCRRHRLLRLSSRRAEKA